MVSLTQLYNERKKMHKEKCKKYSLRRKGAPGSITELRPEFRERNRLKKSLMLNGIKGVVS